MFLVRCVQIGLLTYLLTYLQCTVAVQNTRVLTKWCQATVNWFVVITWTVSNANLPVTAALTSPSSRLRSITVTTMTECGRRPIAGQFATAHVRLLVVRGVAGEVRGAAAPSALEYHAFWCSVCGLDSVTHAFYGKSALEYVISI